AAIAAATVAASAATAAPAAHPARRAERSGQPVASVLDQDLRRRTLSRAAAPSGDRHYLASAGLHASRQATPTEFARLLQSSPARRGRGPRTADHRDESRPRREM